MTSYKICIQEPKIVKLVPPQITKKTILEKISCTRPVRDGKFNISLKQTYEKTIIHCYGHGGSGWTTLFGSVDKAIDLFIKSKPSLNVSVSVIGAGCIGLAMAIELTRLGFYVKRIYAKDLYDMPSWRAAGYFGLVSVKTSPEEQLNLNEMGLKTFSAYQKIDQGNHPYITENAVKLMPVYCGVNTESGIEDLESRGMIPPREYVSLDFDNGIIHHGFIKYMTYFMDTTELMHQLRNEVTRLNIPIIEKKIDSFNDICEEVIFNCTGFGGRELNEDTEIIPIRGHLITLNEDAGSEHMDYMIYTKVNENEFVYLFPKNVSVSADHVEGIPCRGVLGGTFHPNVEKLTLLEQKKLDQYAFQRMLDRNCEFFHGHLF